MQGWVKGFDERIDGWFEPLRSHGRVQQGLYAVSLVAESALVVTGGTAAVIDSPRADATRHRVESLALAAVLTGVAKRVVGRGRPFHPSQRPVHVSPDTASFPSGHTLWAGLAAAWLAEDRWPAWVAYGGAAFVGVSRVHLRLHRASDVAAAAAIAAVAWAFASRRRANAGLTSPGTVDVSQHEEQCDERT